MKKVNVFVIYPLRYEDEIKDHLKIIQQDNKHFRLITFNNRAEWKEEVKIEIEKAKLIIVFIPPEGLTENMEFEHKMAEDEQRAIIDINYNEWENCSEKIQNGLNCLFE